MKQIVRLEHTDQASKSYHRATIAQGLVFPCGQIPVTADGVTPESISEQTTTVLDNLERTLLDCGSSLDSLVQVTVFLASQEEFDEYDVAWRKRLRNHPLPPRTTLFVSGFRGAKRIELTAIAAQTPGGNHRDH
jgi:2-iminobutanoate/2-iminopropanoate deaminase